MRVRTGVVVMALVVAACGGGDGGATSTTGGEARIEAVAEAYAVAAGRALEGTVFESLEPDDLGALVVAVCASPSLAATPDVIVERASSGATVPETDAAILTEVVAVGVVEVCPASVVGATTEAFLAVVRIALETSPLAVTDEALVEAGRAACGALDAGSSAEATYLVVAAALFGVEAASIDGLEAAGLGDDQAVVVGAATASAAAILCPEHHQVVADLAG